MNSFTVFRIRIQLFVHNMIYSSIYFVILWYTNPSTATINKNAELQWSNVVHFQRDFQILAMCSIIFLSLQMYVFFSFQDSET